MVKAEVMVNAEVENDPPLMLEGQPTVVEDVPEDEDIVPLFNLYY